MSNRYLLNETEKRDLIDHLRKRLVEVEADPSATGYAIKLERMISAYENNPGAQMIVVKEL